MFFCQSFALTVALVVLSVICFSRCPCCSIGHLFWPLPLLFYRSFALAVALVVLSVIPAGNLLFPITPPGLAAALVTHQN
jgi:hypothetical protein